MEIKDLQDEFAGLLYSIDNFLKSNLEAETKLLQELKKEPLDNLNLNVSNTLFTQILKLHEEGKTKAEIKTALIPLKQTVGRQVRDFNSKMRAGREIKTCLEKYTKEQLAEFETVYAETLRVYHPLITLTVDQINITTFNMLRRFYMYSNIDSFYGLFKEHPITLHEIKDEEKAKETYEKNIKLYKEQFEKLKSDKRYTNIKNVVSDEALIAREEAAIRQANYKLKQKFEDLKKQIAAAYPEGIDDIIK